MKEEFRPESIDPELYNFFVERYLAKDRSKIREEDWSVFMRKVVASVPGDGEGKKYAWISDRTDISISTIQNWISDRPNKAGKTPSTDNLGKIAELLGLDLAELIVRVQEGMEPPNSNIGGFGAEELKQLAGLSPDELPVLARHLSGIKPATIMAALSNLSAAARYVEN